MKKISLFLLLLLMAVMMTACGSEKEPAANGGTTVSTAVSDTMGGIYLAAFEGSAAADAKSMVDELLALNAAGTELVAMDVTEGYLDGFKEDISGFSGGVRFSPMIGSIPFVGYVLESAEPEALLSQLKEKADPAWNICTQADEIVSAQKGDLVFFLMCSNEK